MKFAGLTLAPLSAGLLVLSFPKFDLSALAWVALVPLLLALDGKSARQACLLSFVTGAGFIAGLFYWIWAVPGYNLLDELLLVGYLSPYIGLWGLGLTWIRARTSLPAVVVAPPLWVSLEYVRSNLSFLSLPWMLLGHSQYSHPALIQITSLTGVYGLSFLIVLVNASLAETVIHLRQRSSRHVPVSLRGSPLVALAVAAVLLLGTGLYGLSVLSRGIDGERLTVALVQVNMPREQKWDRSYVPSLLDRYDRLTRDAARQAPGLVAWPETAIPGDVQHHPELRRYVGDLAVATGTPLLVGSAEQAKFSNRKLTGRLYNSMFLFSPAGSIEGQYRKIALVPFGEYEPLRGVVPWPKAIVAATGNFLPGAEHTLFTVRGVTFGSVICWEIIFPDLVRQFVKQGARLMINATNESWFRETAMPHQMLAMSVFRAAENRVWVARAANTGVAAFIDPFGRITARLRQGDEGVLTGAVTASAVGTFYTRHGDLFAFAQIGLTLLMPSGSCLAGALRRRLLAPA